MGKQTTLTIKHFSERRKPFDLKDQTVSYLKTTAAGQVVEGRVCFCKLSSTLRFGMALMGPDIGTALKRKRSVEREEKEAGQVKKTKK